MSVRHCVATTLSHSTSEATQADGNAYSVLLRRLRGRTMTMAAAASAACPPRAWLVDLNVVTVGGTVSAAESERGENRRAGASRYEGTSLFVGWIHRERKSNTSTRVLLSRLCTVLCDRRRVLFDFAPTEYERTRPSIGSVRRCNIREDGSHAYDCFICLRRARNVSNFISFGSHPYDRCTE